MGAGMSCISMYIHGFIYIYAMYACMNISMSTTTIYMHVHKSYPRAKKR